MKFKGILTDQLCMKDFFYIVSTFARLSKRITFTINEEKLCISNSGQGIGLIPIAWSEISKDEFFTHFVMKGVNEQFNEIWLALHPEQLANALNTLKNHFVRAVIIKLTKKQFPCLSIDIEMAPQNSNNFRRLVHDVPVTVIPIREWEEFQLPILQKYDISIQMPSLKCLRALCDKMKNLAQTMTICSLSTGDLSFIIETDSAIVVSRYFNLIVDRINRNDNNQQSEICCHIDTKHLSMCFGSIQLPSAVMYGSILEEKYFNLRINVRENVLLCFNLQCIENI